MSQFSRGDIVLVSDLGCRGHVQGKTRPYIVVSNNTSNKNSGILNVVPITTKRKKNLVCHVRFNFKGRHQTALCEQITTISIEDVIGFIGFVNDSEIIMELNSAIISQLVTSYGRDNKVLIKEVNVWVYKEKKKLVEDVERGRSFESLSHRYNLSVSTIKRYYYKFRGEIDGERD